MTTEQQARHDSEYQSLQALFIALLRSLRDGDTEESLYALCELKTDFAFKHVLDGLVVEYDEAIILLQSANDDNLTQHDKELRNRLIAAIQNLIDFSVCEEYQLYDEAVEMLGDSELDFNSEDYEDLLAICEKYNDTYASIENSDIEYAGKIAAMWIRMSANDYVVYWTQNDAKVRPWHMALQGYVAPRDEFPSWMIPPIEYNCRCFLEILEVASVNGKLHQFKGAAKDIEKPQKINNVYSESLAKCGRIFGPSHNYFIIKEDDKEMLQGFVTKLKEKYHV